MKNTIIVFITFFWMHYAAEAQLTDKTDRQSGVGQTSSAQQTISSQLPTGKIIQDGPVDPKEYIVGPGDIFSVNIWAATPLMFQVPVTPEGTVVIPTVAEVNIAGMTLDSAKRSVLSEIRRKYITGTASFTLFSPRSFTVSVIGAVLREGTVVVQSTQRIDAALTYANDVRIYKEQNAIAERDPKSTDAMLKKLNSSSKRNITVYHKNGKTVKADLEKYLATRNSRYNPLLLDGDVIVVAPSTIEKDYVGIYGAVAKEGNYEFVEGDSLSTLIRIAGGVTPAADLENGILYSVTEDGGQKQTSVNLIQLLKTGEGDMVLRKGDRLTIPSTSSLNQGGIVTVEGEVKMPGSFPIIRDSTTLSQVIAMAGGFTKYASLNSARIVRDAKNPKDQETEYLRLRRGQTASEDTLYFGNEMLLKSSGEISAADFIGLFVNHDRSKEVILKDGDRIVIPQKLNAVYVFGEVTNPGYIPFQQGKNAEYYITQAGGLTDHSAEGDIRIVKAASKQFLTPGETTLEEGDYIWIPKSPYRPFTYYLTVYSQVFGIVGTIATLFILVSK